MSRCRCMNNYTAGYLGVCGAVLSTLWFKLPIKTFLEVKDEPKVIHVLVCTIHLNEGKKFLNPILTWGFPCCRTTCSCVKEKTPNRTLKVSCGLLSLPPTALPLEELSGVPQRTRVTVPVPLPGQLTKNKQGRVYCREDLVSEEGQGNGLSYF